MNGESCVRRPPLQLLLARWARGATTPGSRLHPAVPLKQNAGWTLLWVPSCVLRPGEAGRSRGSRRLDPGSLPAAALSPLALAAGHPLLSSLLARRAFLPASLLRRSSALCFAAGLLAPRTAHRAMLWLAATLPLRPTSALSSRRSPLDQGCTGCQPPRASLPPACQPVASVVAAH